MLCNHPGGGKVDMYNSGGGKKGYNDSLRQYVFAIHTMQVETKRTKILLVKDPHFSKEELSFIADGNINWPNL